MYWKYAANLLKNIHAEVRFQESCATLLKSHFGIGVLLEIYCMFAKHLSAQKMKFSIKDFCG